MSAAAPLLVVDPEAPFGALAAALRRIAPGLDRVHVVVLLPESAGPLSRGRAGARDLESLLALPQVLGAAREDVPISLETCFDPSQLGGAARRAKAPMVALGPWPSRSARARARTILELTSRHGVDVLSIGGRCGSSPAREGVVGLLVQPSAAQALAEATAALRKLPGLERVAAFVQGPSPRDLDLLERRFASLLPGIPVEWVTLRSSLTGLVDELEAAARDRGVELLVLHADDLSSVSALVARLLTPDAVEHAARPLLVLHRGAEGKPGERLVATDALRLPGQEVVVLVERLGLLGRAELGPNETFRVVGAEGLGALPHEDGVVRIPAAWLAPRTFGAGLFAESSPGTVATVQWLPPGPLALVDAGLPQASLSDVEPLARDHRLIFARLRAAEPLEAVRARLDRVVPWGGPVHLIDVAAWLDDAGSPDVPEAVDAVRLLRAALRIQAAGGEVAAIVTRDEHPPRSPALETWTPFALARRSAVARGPVRRGGSDPQDERLRLLTGAALRGGHRVRLELDNRAARERALADIAGARRRIHWQCYIVQDDATAEEIAAALRGAAGRGVEVRVLVDALYSRHEAFGAKNPVLRRLSETPGVDVRGYQPLSGLPTLIDLKQRNHRKLIVVDGRVATVTGRNLGAPYYRGFEEEALGPGSQHREVPWLDAGAILEGPLVEVAERAFLADWVRSGGSEFPIAPVPPAGEVACRLVLHEGLLDAHTFEAQLHLVRTAQKRLVLVNNFPLALELQRALLGARRRGVRVQLLFGSVRPRWGEDQPFDGGAYRELADDLIRARLDPVIRAGAEGYEFMLPARPPWDPALGRVFPQVHAKLLVRDEDLTAVGSANVDVTSAYWESEALLVVQGADFARSALAQIEPLLAQARRVDLSDERWARETPRRNWLSRHWPPLVG
jgi:cardiolipin synthase